MTSLLAKSAGLTFRASPSATPTELTAVTDFCTHEGVSFTGGYGALFEKKIFCMLHSSIFEIDTGRSISGPAYDPLSIFEVRLDGEDVYVSSDPRRTEG